MKMPQDRPSATRRVRAGAALLLLLSLGSCGFHLRGSYDVPAYLDAVSLKLPPGTAALASELRLALQRKRIEPGGGVLQLEIVSETLTRQTTSVDSSARAAEYILVYTVEFRINSTDGRMVGPLETLILRRSYQYSASNIVGKSAEEATLVDELRSDAAQQIVRQLAAVQPPPATIPAPRASAP